MNTRTSHNHEHRWLGIVADIMMYARHFGMSHEDILACREKRIFSDAAWEKVPARVRQRVNDAFHAGMKGLYRVVLYGASDIARTTPENAQYIRWALRVDGVEVTSDDICARRDADPDIWNRVEGAHIWNHNGNAFGAWKPTKSRV